MNNNKVIKAAENAIKVLMYHSINEADTNPWGICVAPAVFEQQLVFLQKNFTVISVKDALLQLATKNIEPECICITFDDGYADNYLQAESILEKHNCPATFFIATAFIGSTQPYWWDELETILLHTPLLPAHLFININGENNKYVFDDGALTPQQWQQHKQWQWYEAPPTPRCAAFLSIWEKLRLLPYTEIAGYIRTIKKWAGVSDNDSIGKRLPLTCEQLSSLAANSLFTIGLHTHTHVHLPAYSKQVQGGEIATCKNNLKQQFGISSNLLSYPFGCYNTDTISVVKDAGITACFTTEARVINANSDLLKLGRYQAPNGSLAFLKEAL